MNSPRMQIALAGAVAMCLGVAVAVEATVDVVLVLVGGAAIAVLAALRPMALAVLLGGMFLFPYTWSPASLPLAQPVVLVALPAGLLAAAIIVRRGALRLNILDCCVIAIVGSAFLSELATGGNHLLTQHLVKTFLLGYLAYRLIFTCWPEMHERMELVLLWVGVVLSLLAIWEEVRGASPFANSSLTNPALANHAITYLRAGAVRAEATFGQPIAFGSFLIIPIVIAFARRRWTLFVLLAVAEVLTLSRGPYVAAIVAVFLFAAVTRHVGRVTVVAVAAVLVALFVGPVSHTLSASFSTGTTEAANAAYRSHLLETSLSNASFWGTPMVNSSQLFTTGGTFQLSDVTSQIALMVGEQGLAGLTIWLVLLFGLARTIQVGLRRRDQMLIVLGVALVGEWVSLMSVALITTFEYAFVMVLALAASRLSGFGSAEIGTANV